MLSYETELNTMGSGYADSVSERSKDKNIEDNKINEHGILERFLLAPLGPVGLLHVFANGGGDAVLRNKTVKDGPWLSRLCG